MALASRNELPGCPSTRLIRDVKRYLKSRGIHPLETTWRLAWDWAYRVCSRNGLWNFGKNKRKRIRWPRAHEIAAQYLFILLADIRANDFLSLPYAAEKTIPPAVAAIAAAAATREADRKAFALQLAAEAAPQLEGVTL